MTERFKVTVTNGTQSQTAIRTYGQALCMIRQALSKELEESSADLQAFKVLDSIGPRSSKVIENQKNGATMRISFLKGE